MLPVRNYIDLKCYKCIGAHNLPVFRLHSSTSIFVQHERIYWVSPISRPRLISPLRPSACQSEIVFILNSCVGLFHYLELAPAAVTPFPCLFGMACVFAHSLRIAWCLLTRASTRAAPPGDRPRPSPAMAAARLPGLVVPLHDVLCSVGRPFWVRLITIRVTFSKIMSTAFPIRFSNTRTMADRRWTAELPVKFGLKTSAYFNWAP